MTTEPVGSHFWNSAASSERKYSRAAEIKGNLAPMRIGERRDAKA
jgi:hypothetical protein